MIEEDIACLPIDIHVGKLADWIVSRQHASKDWAHATRTIREKINEAIQDMPEHPEIIKLLSGTYINYFHCLKIVDILKETEADSKNILGWYTSQRMKDWQTIVKSYEKGGTSLAESGQLLHRYVIHEIPGIKAQITRCKQIQQECDKREADAEKTATNARNLYQRRVKQIGIRGQDVREELLSLIEGLPYELSRTADEFKGVMEAVHLYRDFISYTCEGRFKDSLPMLTYIIEHGNVSTYEYFHAEAPHTIEDPFADIKKLNQQNKKNNQTDEDEAIDFGGDEVDFGGDDDIDFGIEVEDAEIDFGDVEVEDGIDFGVEETIIAPAESSADGVASGKMALTLLHNSDTRDKILDDMFELEGFLKQRLHEMSCSDDSKMTLNLFDEAPKSLQMVSTDQITAYLSTLMTSLDALTTPRLLQLFLINDSHNYVERLSETLELQESRGHVSKGAVEVLAERRRKSVEQEQLLAVQLVKLQAATKTLQRQLEEAISAKYKSRPVNIMGVAIKN